MNNFTSEDLVNLSRVLAKFDTMGGQFSGTVSFLLNSGKSVSIQYGYNPDVERHVVGLNPTANQ